jgi:hypothetical protein
LFESANLAPKEQNKIQNASNDALQSVNSINDPRIGHCDYPKILFIANSRIPEAAIANGGKTEYNVPNRERDLLC